MLGHKTGHQGRHMAAPKPAGAVTRRCPLALTPPALTLASALARSASRRWASSKKAVPSWVRLIRRVVRTSSFTPKRSSSASMRRPMTAGAMPSARAAAVRLPFGGHRHEGFDLLESIHGPSLFELDCPPTAETTRNLHGVEVAQGEQSGLARSAISDRPLFLLKSHQSITF